MNRSVSPTTTAVSIFDSGPQNDTMQIVPPGMPEIERVDLHGLAPPDPKCISDETTIITVPIGSRWSSGFSDSLSCVSGSVVARPVGRVGVRELMDGDADDQHRHGYPKPHPIYVRQVHYFSRSSLSGRISHFTRSSRVSRRRNQVRLAVHYKRDRRAGKSVVVARHGMIIRPRGLHRQQVSGPGLG